VREEVRLPNRPYNAILTRGYCSASRFFEKNGAFAEVVVSVNAPYPFVSNSDVALSTFHDVEYVTDLTFANYILPGLVVFSTHMRDKILQLRLTQELEQRN
jgi:hypothetical protein